MLREIEVTAVKHSMHTQFVISLINLRRTVMGIKNGM